MTDVKTDGPAALVAQLTVNRWLDWAARAIIVLVFGAYACAGLAGFPSLLPLDSLHKLLMAAASIANIMFLSMVASTTLTRLTPILKAKGIVPRISALLGTFLCMTLVLLPKADLGAGLSAFSTALILIGTSLSLVVLHWLGKSFSILAEARRLVTEGPYGIVRHPLYLCEGIAVVGAVLQVISPFAIAIAIVVAMLQYQRMINEEAVLNSAFPEYRAYAARTPCVIPARLADFSMLKSRREIR
jgi:protein-S-isoprenylcysteine O-methyltransferase Ste14